MRSHELVLEWVEQRLAARDLVLGGRLPGERALADELGVSRTAVREGLRVLEAMGVLRSAVGSGPSAGTVVVAEPAVGLGSALRWHLATDHLSADDIVQTRVLLEGWAVGRIRSDAAELTEAEHLLDEMDRPDLATPDFLDLDRRLHQQLAGAAGNPLVAAMMASIREAIRAYTLAHALQVDDWTATADRLRAEHRAVVTALRAGEPATAAELLTDHIRGYYRST